MAHEERWTSEERRSWIMVAVTVVAYATYLVVVLGGASGSGIAEVAYKKALVLSVGGAIAATIVLDILAGMFLGRGSKDQRDREISRFGETVGGSLVTVGALAALLMALAEWDRFWIANVIYLFFVLSALLSSTAKIISYRKGFHGW